MDIRLKYTHNNRVPLFFMYKPSYTLTTKLNEDMSYVPRFTIKDPKLFNKVPINEPIKPSLETLKVCLEYGLIINIDYKGDGDTKFDGHLRTIYPMAIGKNKEGKYLLRGYHLKGWSLSNSKNIEKEWRMFRIDRILNITFLGSFYRLPPDGYNTSGDKSMAEFIMNANFNTIRKNQEELIYNKQIDLQDRVVVDKLSNIDVKDLNINLKIFDPYKDQIVNKQNAKKTDITFAKPVIASTTTPHIAILGINIVPNKTIKVYNDKKLLGTYKVISNMKYSDLENNNKTIDGKYEFKTYFFIKAY